MKRLLFAGLFFLAGCGTVGYRIARGTGTHGDYRGEIYWDVEFFDLGEVKPLVIIKYVEPEEKK